MRKERDVFLTANTGMKMAEGEDESASAIQSSFLFQMREKQSCTLWNQRMCSMDAVTHGEKG